MLLNKSSRPVFHLQDTITLTGDTIPDQTFNADSQPVHSDTIITEITLSDSAGIPSADTSFIPIRTSSTSLLHAQPSENNIPYYIPDGLNLYQQNQSLRNFSNHFFILKETSDLIFKEEIKTSDSLIQIESPQYLNKNKTISQDFNPDWLIGIVIGSLIMIAALKLFFNKFLDQILVTMWNFQLGSKFLRDQGIFSRRVGFVLNVNFLLVFGLFVYLVLNHFNLNPFSLKSFPSYLVYTSILTVLLLIRYLLTVLTGIIFNRQLLFREYLYHILAIYKNLGIFFIPIVFCIAYIQENLRIYFIIFALVLIALAYLYRYYKGFQIIIKKDVLIFYLILYLCTLEILPVLFYYKFFSGLI